MTAAEWLQAQGLGLSDIDFIETILANQAVHEQGLLDEEQLMILMHQHFPHKIYRPSPKLTLHDFYKLLRDNDFNIDGREVLKRYKDLGFCVALCNRMLTE